MGTTSPLGSGDRQGSTIRCQYIWASPSGNCSDAWMIQATPWISLPYMARRSAKASGRRLRKASTVIGPSPRSLSGAAQARRFAGQMRGGGDSR